MQSDSVQFSTFEDTKESSNQAVAQSNPVRFYNCIKCPIIFKSKVYLYEHLNKVHCLDVDSALKGAGLKYAESHTSRAENLRIFECQSCDFKTFHKDVLKRHNKLCQQTENHNFVETVIISDPESEVLESSTNQCNEAAESRAKCAPKMSKDLKTYKRPQQTITKFFAASSGLSKDRHAKLVDNTKRAPILQETSSSCSPSSSDVCKVSEKSLIDISIGGTHSNKFLKNDELLTTDHGAPKNKDRFEEHNNVGNSTNSSISEGPPAKKIKLGKEVTLPEGQAVKPTPASTDFSFEVSEDEEEKKLHLDNKDSSKPKLYSCKHCDYIDGSFRRMTSHYHIHHPYIRCNADYIQLPNDQGASFRCLECPVEFLSTADLKLHYTEKHPEAADVFKIKVDELNLVFKCFSCPFTTNLLKALGEHYKEKHPAYNLNKPLFSQYSESKCQDESTLVKMHENMSSSKNSKEISPEKISTSCKEDQITLSPKHPTSNEPDVTLYQCSNCGFMHKSAVVMHVHYQKNHPDMAITIDKITQSVRDASQRIPEKTKDKSELSLQKRSELTLPEHTADASKKPSEVSTTKPVESVQAKTTTPSSKCKRKTIPGLGSKSFDSPAKWYCQFCSYTSTEVRSVLGHHFARHSTKASVTMKDIFKYSATVRKRIVKSHTQLKARKSKISTNIETDLEKDGAEDVSVNESHASANAENLFFCQKCNYGNSNLQSVINHQVKAHSAIGTSNSLVIEHTALVREQLKNTNSKRKSSSSYMHVPLPILNDGDEDKFFCDLCNFRHTTMTKVLSHYSKMHHSSLNKAADIHRYTAMVLKQVSKSFTNQEKKESTMPTAPPSVSVSEPLRKLKCYICAYSTPYVSVLKAHMRKFHNSNRSVSEILGVCFRQGVIKAGYHCEWCVFDHKNPKVVYKHYQEHHPDCKASLDYVRNRLCVGLNKLPLKKKKLKLKSTHLGNTDTDMDSSLTSKSLGQNDSETYSCTMCSFQSSSKSDLACHKNEAHSKLAEDNKSNPSKNKGASAKSQLEDLNDLPGVFESFQMPCLEDNDETKQISTVFKCSSCPATFISQHGLNVHCGRKHLELVSMEESRKQVKSQMRVHVFKCPHCTYINTVYQGILTHCQMKHPDLESRADSLHVDLVHIDNMDEYSRRHESGESLKFKGHMCKTCPKICTTLNKLNSHCERDHSDNLPSTPKPATELSAVSKIKLTKPCAFDKSVWKASLLSKTKKRVTCQYCTYPCSSKVGLSRHMQTQHMDMFPKDSLYNCPLCHLFYFRQLLLGRHIAKRHGKAAYSKYYVPLYKQATKKPVSLSQDHPSPQQQQNNSSEDKRLVYKCPKCPYVHVNLHGVRTHCQMKHPLLERRTKDLEMGEIFVSDIVSCSTGKGTYERGYLCKRCPQIHPSLIKLKNHCKMEHRKMAASELSAETEANNPLVDDPPDATPEAGPIDTAQANVTEASPSLCTLKTSDLSSLLTEDKCFKCQLCTYATFSRSYLWKHYKNLHKLSSASRSKLLQKYNKRNCNYLQLNAEHERTVNCGKCPDLVLDSPQSLIDHYNTFHQLGYKSDFTVISFGVKRKKTTGVYKCAHCLKKLNGTRKLRVHLDHHRAVMRKMAMETEEKALPVSPSADPEPIELSRQDEVSVTESVEELAEQNETSEKDVVQPSSPQASTSKVTEAEPDVEVIKDRFPCKQCHRCFQSLKGQRSHERSHAVMAAIKNLDNLSTAELKHDIKKCIFYKTGTQKPFRCSCCSYKTNLMGLMQSHILKNHQDILQRDNVETISNDEEISQEPSDSSEKNNLPELDDESEETEETLYLEPADVQRQLNHYSWMAQITDKRSTNVLELTLPENCLLQCEMCNFNTEHLSSIRRHYLNRHGKKMLKCKDCEFLTCSRKTLKMHVQMGHSTCQSEPTHQKDLRCPFCLYQTKNKNNMIDHIVLHREERVVPVELRRPKLSRYLQGIVFRCHRCTFSSGSIENLRLHMIRHDDLKPYQCRLCYFDCTRLADLEAHLSDKHQVLRNHELVGQVNIDQLEARIGRMLEKDDDFNTNSKEVETEEFSSDFDKVPQTNSVAEYDTEGRTVPTSEEAQEEQEHDENEESPAKSSVSDIQYDDAQPNTTVQKGHEQDLKPQEVNVALHVSAGQIVIKIEQNPNECNKKHIPYEGCSDPEKEEQTTKYPSRLTDDPKQKAAESSSCIRKAVLSHANKLHIKELQQRPKCIDAKTEDDIVRHVLLLDESGSKSHKWENQKQAVKMEPNVEAKNRNDAVSDDASLDKEDSATLAQNPIIQAISAKINYAQANDIRADGGLERQLQTHSPSHKQLNLNNKDSVCLTNCKQEQQQTQETCMDASQPCREMLVLEKECHVEKQQLLETCKEEEETDKLELKQEEEVEMMTEDETQCEKQEMSDIHNGVMATRGGAAEVLLTEKPFTCVLCGRNLLNISELNRHITRHRL